MTLRNFLRRLELTIPVMIWRPQVVDVSTRTANQLALSDRSSRPDSLLRVEACGKAFISPEAITPEPATSTHSRIDAISTKIDAPVYSHFCQQG